MAGQELDAASIEAFLRRWLEAWNRHDLEAVLRGMAEDAVFEHWNGRVVRGKQALAKAWGPWFEAHGEFRFDLKSLCVDPARQAFSFEWALDWPVPPGNLPEVREVRHGIDHIQLREGLVAAKRSYIRTVPSFGGSTGQA
ncbi:MAG: nuclear transport factor 2 family protein [Acidobacteria bacterium]|nr:nuclear transport factor 2 family protein [Acidobacteriota bacterium]